MKGIVGILSITLLGVMVGSLFGVREKCRPGFAA